MKLRCCCECWRLGVPPSWLVLLGAVLVQIKKTGPSVLVGMSAPYIFTGSKFIPVNTLLCPYPIFSCKHDQFIRDRLVLENWTRCSDCISAYEVGYGLYPVMLKKFAVVSSPIVFSFYRDLFCAPLLFLCAVLVERKLLFPGLKILLVFVFLGGCMYVSQLLFILGVYLVGPNVSSAIQPIIPVWTCLLVLLTCTEKISHPLHLHTWVKIIGILLATGSAIEIALTQVKDGTDSTPSAPPTANVSLHESHHVSKQVLGYSCLMGNTLSTAVYIVVQKRFIFNQQNTIWKSQPVYVTAYSYVFSSGFMGFTSLYHVATREFHKFVIQGETIYALIYAVVVASAICCLLLSWSNMHLSPTIVTAFWPVQVFVAVVSAFFITGDKLAPLQYLGAVLVIVALFMVLFSNHMDERHQVGKKVPLVTCRLSKLPRPTSLDDDYRHEENDERKHLLVNHYNSKGLPPYLSSLSDSQGEGSKAESPVQNA